MPVLPAKQVFTIGHSTRSLADFLSLLRDHQIGCLIDIRRAPKSRRLPHFAKEALAESIRDAGIEYVHEPALGGWRKPVPGSRNDGWRTKGFQGYADYMATPAFEVALGHLMDIAARRRSALMCAEALWWRCHRMLISDALTVRGWRVRHIGAAKDSQDHRITPFAVADGERLSYPAAQGTLPLRAACVSRPSSRGKHEEARPSPPE